MNKYFAIKHKTYLIQLYIMEMNNVLEVDENDIFKIKRTLPDIDRSCPQFYWDVDIHFALRIWSWNDFDDRGSDR